MLTRRRFIGYTALAPAVLGPALWAYPESQGSSDDTSSGAATCCASSAKLRRRPEHRILNDQRGAETVAGEWLELVAYYPICSLRRPFGAAS